MIETIINKNPNITFLDLENEYKNTSSKITYSCSKHGEHSRRALYLMEGRGCSKCSSEKARANKKSNTEFINKANEVHNNIYDYSKTEYIKSHDKVIITCSRHGDFEQLPYSHLQGKGCPSCGKIEASKNSYISSAQSSMSALYYIKCYGNREIFYKIGVTKNRVTDRYNTPQSMPYLYEVIREITGDTETILEIEKTIKLDLKLYSPKIPFAGSSTECTQTEIELDGYLI